MKYQKIQKTAKITKGSGAFKGYACTNEIKVLNYFKQKDMHALMTLKFQIILNHKYNCLILNLSFCQKM